MIKYIKNHFKKRREFKESIKGMFDDWEIDHIDCVLSKGNYELWVGNDFTSFEDYRPRNRFLATFSFWERWLLWQEVKKKLKFKGTKPCEKIRKAINKEFNLK
mgnify:CR=1 FL=1